MPRTGCPLRYLGTHNHRTGQLKRLARTLRGGGRDARWATRDVQAGGDARARTRSRPDDRVRREVSFLRGPLKVFWVCFTVGVVLKVFYGGLGISSGV